MKLCMEIPITLLEEISPLCDLDFALAHKVLENSQYMEFYKQQSDHGRRVILDNSFHELGRPLGTAELLQAANLIRPWVVVAPDKLGAPKENLQWFWETRTVLKSKHRLGIVLSGSDFAERFAYLDSVKAHIDVLFLPFKEPRVSWFKELARSALRNYLQHIPLHLLGVNQLAELLEWKSTLEEVKVASEKVSIDTSKPVKFGLATKKFTAVSELRGAGLLDHDAVVTDCAQRACIYYNIAYLRRYL